MPLAGPEVRLIIDIPRKLVDLDGVSAQVPPRPFKFLTALAHARLAGEGFVEPRTLLDRMRMTGSVSDKTLADTRYDLIQALRKAGVPEPSANELIENRRSESYRLTLAAQRSGSSRSPLRPRTRIGVLPTLCRPTPTLCRPTMRAVRSSLAPSQRCRPRLFQHPTISASDLQVLRHEADAAARRLLSRLRLSRCDLADLRQEFLLEVLARLLAFDAGRGSLGAFAGTVMAHKAARIARKVSRERAFYAARPVSLDEPLADGDGTTLGDMVAEQDSLASFWHSTSPRVPAA